MNILMAGLFTPTGRQPIGGTQTWMKTIADHLPGHEVHYWEPGQQLNGQYDLGIISQVSRTKKAIDHCRNTILVSHGVVKEEKPEPLCDVTLAVSEEVRDHWQLNCDIIRQPIDTTFWSPSPKVNRTLLARFAYRVGETKSKDVAKMCGLTYTQIKGMTQHEARKIIRTSAVVHASGRAALEAMSCGIPTVIYDHRKQYQGEYLEENFLSSMKTNYSGRGGVENPTLQQVTNTTQTALVCEGYREHIEKYHDAKHIAEKLLCYNY